MNTGKALKTTTNCFLDQNHKYQNQHAISLSQFSDYTMTVTSENEAPNQSLHHTTLRSSTNISSVTWQCLARADTCVQVLSPQRYSHSYGSRTAPGDHHPTLLKQQRKGGNTAQHINISGSDSLASARAPSLHNLLGSPPMPQTLWRQPGTTQT